MEFVQDFVYDIEVYRPTSVFDGFVNFLCSLGFIMMKVISGRISVLLKECPRTEEAKNYLISWLN